MNCRHSEFLIPNSEFRTPLVPVPPFHWWRTVFYLIPAISVYTIVLGAASIASSVFDRRGHFAHRCARAWSWLILKTTGVRVAVEGLERLMPGTTYVFVSNHQSIYDTPVIFASLPYQLRIIAKESLARFPGARLAPEARPAPVRRSPPARIAPGSCSAGARSSPTGLSLIIYAEGTRSPDGRVARFKAGSFLLAIEAGLPIVPLAVIGTRRVMPKGRLRTEPADVMLVVHEPDRCRRPSSGRPRSDAKALAGRVHDIVAASVDGSPDDRVDIIGGLLSTHACHGDHRSRRAGPAVRQRHPEAAASASADAPSSSAACRSFSSIRTCTRSSSRCPTSSSEIRRRTCGPPPSRSALVAGGAAAAGLGAECLPGSERSHRHRRRPRRGAAVRQRRSRVAARSRPPPSPARPSPRCRRATR